MTLQREGLHLSCRCENKRLASAIFFLLAILFIYPTFSHAQIESTWSRGVQIGPDGRANPYELPDSVLQGTIYAGRLHALHYPVEITGTLLPYAPTRRFFEADSTNPLKHFLQKTLGGLSRMRSFEDMEKWLGLHSYPKEEGVPGVYNVPFKDGARPEQAMGITLIDTPQGRGFTISCAQCHTGDLFGQKVIGLTNRFPRANRFFAAGLRVEPFVSANAFRWATDATADEAQMFLRAKKSLSYVEAQTPVQEGLDTSLAQVALSLKKRGDDPWASREFVAHATTAKKYVADSKPAVWWNVKYKNRWLSDGSVISGNPIFTNILWNEIGRGTDLHDLDRWLQDNSQIITELTTAVFSNQAPRYTDFFQAESFPIEEAIKGEPLYKQHCAGCHGQYEKAWNLPNANFLSAEELLRTTRVVYKEKTPVIDVGTDPHRWQGMRQLEDLNKLQISQNHGIRIETQKGYVPPPLVGIWARWPYFHNNSAPSLCAVLTRASERPTRYWAREANDRTKDFDSECNGYPLSGRPAGAPKSRLFETKRTGLSNSGHDERIFIKDGKEVMTAQEKKHLIRFLQTL